MMSAVLPNRSASASPSGDATAVAVLSWAWAAVSVEPAGAAPARWLAAHPSDARLAAHLASFSTPACRF